jgi:hypothetical protein
MISPQSILTEGSLARALVHGERMRDEKAAVTLGLAGNLTYERAAFILGECRDDYMTPDEYDRKLREHDEDVQDDIEEINRCLGYIVKERQYVDELVRGVRKTLPTAGICRICERFTQRLCPDKLCRSCADERRE